MSLTQPLPPTVAVGQRIRNERIRRRLSQADLAAEVGFSGSYLSLIESGRRPVGQAALERIAAALHCTAEYLQTGRGGADQSDLELDLRFAEMALRAGDAEAARERFGKAGETAHERGVPDVEVEARWGLARAAEALGSLESAIVGYEAVAREEHLPGALERAVVLTALCRAYQECGDLTRAVEVGESALAVHEQADAGRPLSDAVIALASTLVGCYFERGDMTRAQLLARTTLERAEENGSSQARAAALWNAGLVSEARGDWRTARSYIDRALALYSETDNARATALLRVASAWIGLQEETPDISAAENLLTRALQELPVVGSDLDVAYAETEMVRCHLLRGEAQAAVALAGDVVRRLSEQGPRIETARARLLLADAKLVQGDIDAAAAGYMEAADQLRAFGAHRQAASAWRELAERMARLGRTAEALDAYRSAADAAGVVAPSHEFERITRSISVGWAAEAVSSRRPQQRSKR